MPSTSQPSPYAEPNTPIASAKRPRTAIRHTGTPHGKQGASQGSSHLLQSPPPACQLEQPSPNAEADATEREQEQQEQQQHRRRVCEGVGNNGEGNEGAEGSWKGRVVSLFSPVLKFVGGHQQGEADAEEEDGVERNPSGEGDENDLNVENRAAGGPRGLQLHKEESGTSSAGDAMEVEAPLTEGEEEEGQEDGDEGEEEQGDEYEGEELDVVEEFNPFLFIKQLPPYEHVAIPGKICLPQRAVAAATGAKYNTRSGAPVAAQAPPPPVTLVLDLDETLVHCTVEPVPDPDMVFPVEFNGVQYQVHVRKRPHLEEFLARVAKMFEVVVFTASQQVYADALLNMLDPGRKLIKHRLFRDACLPVEGNYIKDLNVLGRDIARTVLIDNSPYAYGYQLDNGIPIESWFEDRDDMELLKLLPFLEELQTADDVRPLIRNTFQSQLRVEEA